MKRNFGGPLMQAGYILLGVVAVSIGLIVWAVIAG